MKINLDNRLKLVTTINKFFPDKKVAWHVMDYLDQEATKFRKYLVRQAIPRREWQGKRTVVGYKNKKFTLMAAKSDTVFLMAVEDL